MKECCSILMAVVDPGTRLWGVCVLHQQQQCCPQGQQAPGRELVVYPHLGEGGDKGYLPVHRSSSGCSLQVHSLVLNTFVQGLIRLVGFNLTPVRMRLTDIWAGCGTSCEASLRYGTAGIPRA